MLRSRPKGIALFLTLLVTSVLIMLLTATMTSTTGGNIFSQDYHRKTAALYAAESGLAMVQEELESDSTFHAPLIDEDTPFKTGKFTIRWSGPGRSVNNLSNDAEVNGPRGPVPAHSAYIRVEGRALGQTEVIECMLGQRSDDFLQAALTATGKIYFKGDVAIGGHQATEDLKAAEADVISNDDTPATSGTSNIQWDSGSGATGKVGGTIRSAGSGANAISSNLQPPTSTQALSGQAPVPVKNINIKRAIEEKNSGFSGIPSDGRAGPGTYYDGGDRTVAGDLVLENANIYVKDDLTIIGSIKGVGAIYVGGKTTFSGDSQVVATEEGIALYSHGDVKLTGFNGTAWMDAVTGNSQDWQDTKESFRRFNDYMSRYALNTADNAPMTILRATTYGETLSSNSYWSSEAGLILANLSYNIEPMNIGYRPTKSEIPINSSAAAYISAPKMETNLLFEMITVIKGQPAGPTRDFMLEKFAALRDPNQVNQSSPPSPPLVAGTDFTYPASIYNIAGALGINYGNPTGGSRPDWVTKFLDEGIPQDAGLQLELWIKAGRMNGGSSQYDGTAAGQNSVTHPELERALKKHAHWLDLYSYDRLGASFFQGNIYTRGAFFAANEVTIIGSLSAVADPNESDALRNVGGIMMRSGDVHLGAGTRIEHLAKLEAGPVFTGRPVGVSYWLR